ncbi:hypothetical protein DIPPA_04571 [Diplonema papillatum]|nr:hypothetical protein DIPPA_04571 [Diplonema papillatum]
MSMSSSDEETEADNDAAAVLLDGLEEGGEPGDEETTVLEIAKKVIMHAETSPAAVVAAWGKQVQARDEAWVVKAAIAAGLTGRVTAGPQRDNPGSPQKTKWRKRAETVRPVPLMLIPAPPDNTTQLPVAIQSPSAASEATLHQAVRLAQRLPEGAVERNVTLNAFRQYTLHATRLAASEAARRQEIEAAGSRVRESAFAWGRSAGPFFDALASTLVASLHKTAERSPTSDASNMPPKAPSQQAELVLVPCSPARRPFSERNAHYEPPPALPEDSEAVRLHRELMRLQAYQRRRRAAGDAAQRRLRARLSGNRALACFGERAAQHSHARAVALGKARRGAVRRWVASGGEYFGARAAKRPTVHSRCVEEQTIDGATSPRSCSSVGGVAIDVRGITRGICGEDAPPDFSTLPGVKADPHPGCVHRIFHAAAAGDDRLFRHHHKLLGHRAFLLWLSSLRDGFGRTPFHFAAFHGQLSVIRYVLNVQKAVCPLPREGSPKCYPPEPPASARPFTGRRQPATPPCRSRTPPAPAGFDTPVAPATGPWVAPCTPSDRLGLPVATCEPRAAFAASPSGTGFSPFAGGGRGGKPRAACDAGWAGDGEILDEDGDGPTAVQKAGGPPNREAGVPRQPSPHPTSSGAAPPDTTPPPQPSRPSTPGIAITTPHPPRPEVVTVAPPPPCALDPSLLAPSPPFRAFGGKAVSGPSSPAGSTAAAQEEEGGELWFPGPDATPGHLLTSLHYAVMGGKLRAVEMMVEEAKARGAAVLMGLLTAKTTDGLTPAALAVRYEWGNIVHYLRGVAKAVMGTKGFDRWSEGVRRKKREREQGLNAEIARRKSSMQAETDAFAQQARAAILEKKRDQDAARSAWVRTDVELPEALARRAVEAAEANAFLVLRTEHKIAVTRLIRARAIRSAKAASQTREKALMQDADHHSLLLDAVRSYSADKGSLAGDPRRSSDDGHPSAADEHAHATAGLHRASSPGGDRFPALRLVFHYGVAVTDGQRIPALRTSVSYGSVLVLSAAPPASTAGIRAGDTVVSVWGRPVASCAAFYAALGRLEAAFFGAVRGCAALAAAPLRELPLPQVPIGVRRGGAAAGGEAARCSEVLVTPVSLVDGRDLCENAYGLVAAEGNRDGGEQGSREGVVVEKAARGSAVQEEDVVVVACGVRVSSLAEFYAVIERNAAQWWMADSQAESTRGGQALLPALPLTLSRVSNTSEPPTIHTATVLADSEYAATVSARVATASPWSSIGPASSTAGSFLNRGQKKVCVHTHIPGEYCTRHVPPRLVTYTTTRKPAGQPPRSAHDRVGAFVQARTHSAGGTPEAASTAAPEGQRPAGSGTALAARKPSPPGGAARAAPCGHPRTASGGAVSTGGPFTTGSVSNAAAGQVAHSANPASGTPRGSEGRVSGEGGEVACPLTRGPPHDCGRVAVVKVRLTFPAPLGPSQTVAVSGLRFHSHGGRPLHPVDLLSRGKALPADGLRSSLPMVVIASFLPQQAPVPLLGFSIKTAAGSSDLDPASARVSVAHAGDNTAWQEWTPIQLHLPVTRNCWSRMFPLQCDEPEPDTRALFLQGSSVC